MFFSLRDIKQNTHKFINFAILFIVYPFQKCIFILDMKGHSLFDFFNGV